MSKSIESAVVRIYSINRRTVGAGFLVRERHIITCAHVITSALDLSSDDVPSDWIEVHLNFPLLAPKHYFSTSICRWQPELDVAGLKLTSEGPDGAKPVRLVTGDDVWGHRFRAVGFPPGYADGVWSSGVLRGRTAAGWLQIDDVKEPGYWVQSGFSGTPIWDEQLDGVVGMAVAADTNQTVKSAYIIPADRLAEAWPGAIRVHSTETPGAETTAGSGGVTIGNVTGGIHGTTIAGGDVHFHREPRRQPYRDTGATSGKADLTALRELLIEGYSESELQDLSFDLGVGYESLPGRGKAGKARELIAYLKRRSRIGELIEVGQRQRPDLAWKTVFQGD